MKVAVIGAGKMGGAFAKALAPKHEVMIGSRDPKRGAMLAKEIGVAGGGSYAHAAAGAEVVFLSIPWVGVDEALPELGDLNGRVLIDVTNPYVGGKLRLHDGSSNAEEIQRKVPGARVVKGWNTIFSAVANSSPEFEGQAASVFLAGDDSQAKEIVASLAREMGYDPVDCGPLAGARDLEGLVGLFGTLGHSLDRGSWALKVLRRPSQSA
jgi:predicted dinucleotide-binding enzyme